MTKEKTMYEGINQSANAAYDNRALQASATIAAAGLMAGNSIRDKPLMNIEFDRTQEAVSGLEHSIDELLARIQPVCQPSPVQSDTKLASGAISNMPEATPSEIRSRLVGLRIRIAQLSSRIAGTRYTIEV
jgi:hypothetical protein